MWDTLERTSADAPSQAAHSARELIDQLLKGVRLKRSRRRSDPNWDLIEAVHSKLISEAHGRRPENKATVRSCIQARRFLNWISGSIVDCGQGLRKRNRPRGGAVLLIGQGWQTLFASACPRHADLCSSRIPANRRSRARTLSYEVSDLWYFRGGTD
jgi:hypothetical protein